VRHPDCCELRWEAKPAERSNDRVHCYCCSLSLPFGGGNTPRVRLSACEAFLAPPNESHPPHAAPLSLCCLCSFRICTPQPAGLSNRLHLRTRGSILLTSNTVVCADVIQVWLLLRYPVFRHARRVPWQKTNVGESLHNDHGVYPTHIPVISLSFGCRLPVVRCFFGPPGPLQKASIPPHALDVPT
jgi:hypothetical protein